MIFTPELKYKITNRSDPSTLWCVTPGLDGQKKTFMSKWPYITVEIQTHNRYRRKYNGPSHLWYTELFGFHKW